MRRPILLLAFVASCSPAVAQSRGGYFKRYHTLAARFPKAFAAYTNLDYLVPTRRARWVDHEVEIGARPMPIALDKPTGPGSGERIFAEVYFTDGKIDLDVVEIGSRYGREYGWRILIAEILMKYPATHEIFFNCDTEFDWSDLAQCAELLARGHTVDEVVAVRPLTRAAADFGFAARDSAVRRSIADPEHAGTIGLTTRLVRTGTDLE